MRINVSCWDCSNSIQNYDVTSKEMSMIGNYLRLISIHLHKKFQQIVAVVDEMYVKRNKTFWVESLHKQHLVLNTLRRPIDWSIRNSPFERICFTVDAKSLWWDEKINRPHSIITNFFSKMINLQRRFERMPIEKRTWSMRIRVKHE